MSQTNNQSEYEFLFGDKEEKTFFTNCQDGYEFSFGDKVSQRSICPNSKKIKKTSKSTYNDSESESPSKTSSSSKQKRCTWKSNEDAQVLDLVAKHGTKWTIIATFMSHRTAKQIRDRYLHKLRPDIQPNYWTPAEDYTLLCLYQKYGPKWALIVKFMPNKTENQVRNRFNSRLKTEAQAAQDCSSSHTAHNSQSPAENLSIITDRENINTFEHFAAEIFNLTPEISLDSEPNFNESSIFNNHKESDLEGIQETNVQNFFADFPRLKDSSGSGQASYLTEYMLDDFFQLTN